MINTYFKTKPCRIFIDTSSTHHFKKISNLFSFG